MTTMNVPYLKAREMEIGGRGGVEVLHGRERRTTYVTKDHNCILLGPERMHWYASGLMVLASQF